MIKLLPELYFSDLSDNMQRELITHITVHRPELIKKIKDYDDIIVGQLFDYKNMGAIGDYNV